MSGGGGTSGPQTSALIGTFIAASQKNMGEKWNSLSLLTTILAQL